MSDKYFARQINIHVEEKIVAVLHHHPLTYAKQIVVTAVLILGSFFLMFPLFSLDQIGVALFCALLLTGIIYGAREFYIWYANACVVTSQRLVDLDRQGIFHKTVSDLELDSIIDISYSVSGIVQTIFHIGAIEVKSGGAALLLENIKEPGKINQLLADLIRKQTGKQIEVKKVVSLGPKAKDKLMDNFVHQDELDEYEDYNLNELLEDYKETFGELSLKKLLVDELDEEDEKDGEEGKEGKEGKEGNSFKEKTAGDEIEGNFRQKHL